MIPCTYMLTSNDCMYVHAYSRPCIFLRARIYVSFAHACMSAFAHASMYVCVNACTHAR